MRTWGTRKTRAFPLQRGLSLRVLHARGLTNLQQMALQVGNDKIIGFNNTRLVYYCCCYFCVQGLFYFGDLRINKPCAALVGLI